MTRTHTGTAGGRLDRPPPLDNAVHGASKAPSAAKSRFKVRVFGSLWAKVMKSHTCRSEVTLVEMSDWPRRAGEQQQPRAEQRGKKQKKQRPLLPPSRPIPHTPHHTTNDPPHALFSFVSSIVPRPVSLPPSRPGTPRQLADPDLHPHHLHLRGTPGLLERQRRRRGQQQLSRQQLSQQQLLEPEHPRRRVGRHVAVRQQQQQHRGRRAMGHQDSG